MQKLAYKLGVWLVIISFLISVLGKRDKTVFWYDRRE